MASTPDGHRLECRLGDGGLGLRLKRSASLLALEVIATGQRADHDMDGEHDLRLAIDPLGEALQKNAARAEEETDAEPVQRFRRATPKETFSHLKPAQPEQH